MTDERSRFYVDAEGPDDDAVRLGLAWLANEAKKAGAGTLHAPGLQNFEYLSHLIPSIGAIVKRKSFQLEGTTVHIATPRTGRIVGAVLALWTDDRTLQVIEDRARPLAICAIPWLRKDISNWVAAHSPRDLRSGSATSAVKVSNPVVEEALRSLTSSVNLATGLGHPSDHDAAVWTFRALRQAGEGFDPDEIRAWASSHGWRMGDADELADFARRVNEGRQIRTGSRPWREEIVELWRQRATQGDDSS